MTTMSQKPQSDDTAGGVCRAMTDAELDALVMAMTEQCAREHTYDSLHDEAATAITTLRAQLAEARTERDNAYKIMDDWTTLHRVIADIRGASGLGSRPMLSELAGKIGRRIAAANARADRAEFNAAQLAVMVGEDAVEQIEAALSAQIEADAGLLQTIADGWDCGHNESKYCRCAELAEQWSYAADAVRAQPHDRTALDAAIRAAKVKAWKEVATLGLATGRECQLAILALIEREGGE